MIFPVTDSLTPKKFVLSRISYFFSLQLDASIDNVSISDILVKILNNMIADMCAFRIAIKIKLDSAAC